ncbi:MAG: phage major capsid protein [Pseudomonadota bacterium]
MTVETKAGHLPGDIRSAMADFLGAFEHFKQANDERLQALEQKKGDDVVLNDKIERLNKSLDEQKSAIDRVMLEKARPAFGASVHQPNDEQKAAFQGYVRRGDVTAISSFEQKALNATNDSEGGYFAPETVERIINDAVVTVSPFRQIATVREIGANGFKKPVNLTGAGAGWVSETGARVETSTPTLTAIDFPTMELYAMPAASQALLDDAVIDIEQWLADEVQTEFAVQETTAFTSGNGTTQPKGILTETFAANDTRGASEIGTIATGVDGAFPASNAADVLLDLIYASDQSYRANGRFVMNRSAVAEVRKLKDSDGNYIWHPSHEAGSASTLLGYPVTEVEDMPGISTGSNSILFGDFRRGYLIVDRQGIRVLRDPYSAKPYVLFYTTKRVGGGVQDFDAIKALQFSAS